MFFLVKSLFFLLFIFGFSAEARVYINVGEAQVKKSLIALSPLVHQAPSTGANDLRYGREIFSRIKKNLQSSGYFDFIPQQAFIENPARVGVEPYPKNPKGFRWENWKLLNAEFLMLSRYSVDQGTIQMRVYVYDVLLRKNLFKKVYSAPVAQRISLAHFVCNDMIKYLTKKPGIFLTKIAAVRNTSRVKKEIFVMNWDGSNPKQTTFHRSIVMSPSWLPSGKKLAYTAFVYRRSLQGRRAHIFVYDFFRKKRKMLSSYYGTNIGADFLPSGREMLISIPSKAGGLDIFKFSLFKKRFYPIKLGPKGVINVEPAVSPDGKKIVFSSDRSGRVMLYQMDRFGDNVKQLTFVGKYNSSPDWSPDGRHIVFSGYSGGRFDLFLIKNAGLGNSKITRLTTAKKTNGSWADNESPSFSPDGRQIVFVSNRSGVNQLYLVNADGSNLRRITFDRFNYKNPKWSPLIKEFF